MQSTSLVTGANGHLGNNLVRVLVGKGERVIAGVRNPAHADALRKLGSEVARVDLLDKASLLDAMRGVDVLYQVGAVFKHWAKDPERDIYHANLAGTRHALEAAAEAGVERVVYVSSLAALDHTRMPITETGWNANRSNVYYRSKTDSEWWPRASSLRRSRQHRRS
ncbi:MAG TPA: NAD(P)H-binding protein [Thermoanaerobaculia bacterium]